MYMQFSLLSNNAIEPVRHGAGLDIFIPAMGYPVVCASRIVVTIDTQLAVQIPDGYYGQLALRSSVGQQGLVLLGGVIDSDYRGPIKVMVSNTTDYPVVLQSGTRFAQLLVIPILTPQPLLVQAHELTATSRGSKGFGSTGTN